MPWHRLPKRPTGPREGPRPLASASFENEQGCRIQVYLMPAHPEWSPAALKPGFTLEWSFKEPGKAWTRPSIDPFCAWPAELTGELVTLIQDAGTRVVADRG